jgi:hypothetical protein
MKFKRRRPAGFTSVLILGAAIAIALGATSSGSRVAAQQPDDNGIAPEGRAQIQALLAEKETRTPAERKIDSQLLYAWRMQQGLPVAPGVQTLEVDVPYADDGHVMVDVKANVTANLLARLDGLTGEVVKTSPADLQLHVNPIRSRRRGAARRCSSSRGNRRSPRAPAHPRKSGCRQAPCGARLARPPAMGTRRLRCRMSSAPARARPRRRRTSRTGRPSSAA